MSIPLDRLYHFIENIAEEIYGSPIIIYRFYPYGSKKLEDLTSLKHYEWQEINVFPGVYCNDQEPLNFDLYENYEFSDLNNTWDKIVKSLSMSLRKNLKNSTIYNKAMLLHSEQRSKNLAMYQQHQYIPIYYWNHALLARDWFRYAEHMSIKKMTTKKFLIYNRAWSGTREYRLKFADLLINYNIVNDCQTSIGFTDQNTHYKDYKFTNTNWQPMHQLENYFTANITSSACSADFSIEDYTDTDIEVVLETLFDDDRLHLTEKSLRPIAGGQPFILTATHGSLKYLKSYGFKTFSDVIDESYDQIENPEKRLQAIVSLMKQITNWTDDEKNYKMIQLRQISEYNKQHFFSAKFLNQVINELKENCSTAFTEFNSSRSCNRWISRWDFLLLHKSIRNFLKNNKDWGPTTNQLKTVYKEAKKYIK